MEEQSNFFTWTDATAYDELREVMDTRNRHLKPEAELCMAVLWEAINNYVGKSNCLRRDARQWFLADEDYSWPFTFASVCSTLNLEWTAVRRAILALKQTEPNKKKQQFRPPTNMDSRHDGQWSRKKMVVDRARIS